MPICKAGVENSIGHFKASRLLFAKAFIMIAAGASYSK
jgi:hypothetical protein